jgi:hypothetical protein
MFYWMIHLTEINISDSTIELPESYFSIRESLIDTYSPQSIAIIRKECFDESFQLIKIHLLESFNKLSQRWLCECESFIEIYLFQSITYNVF